MIIVKERDKETDYTELEITSIAEDGASMPTMTKGSIDIPRCSHGSVAIDDEGNTYRLKSDNAWSLISE